MKISVITLTHHREDHLKNVLRGLSHATVIPDEFIVVRMNEAIQPFDATPFSVKQIVLNHASKLPLAKARNTGAEASEGDFLVFLDVDCIPAASLIEKYLEAYTLCEHNGIFMGNTRYLFPNTLLTDHNEPLFLHHSQTHPIRDISKIDAIYIPEYDPTRFWSLSFAMDTHTFSHIGGFDDVYTGYGAEDTDFALSAAKADVPFYWVPQALAFHQYHEAFTPPANHLQSIITNARQYKSKWGTWPMEGWLQEFAKHGWIHWQPDSEDILLTRLPDIKEVESCRRIALF